MSIVGREGRRALAALLLLAPLAGCDGGGVPGGGSSDGGGQPDAPASPDGGTGSPEADAGGASDASGSDAGTPSDAGGDPADGDAPEVGETASDGQAGGADGSGDDALDRGGSCDEAADCDDGLGCTTASCTEPDGVCSWSLDDGHCLIHGGCYAAEEAHPSDPCRRCRPDEAPHAWTTVEDGTSCDDGNACTTDDVCQDGTCTGTDEGCDDGNPCTEDGCDPDEGCTHEPRANGLACDDDDPCTTDDRCQGGTCTGTDKGCDDGNPCTEDACDPETGECSHEPLDGEPCDDGDACTVDDACVEGTCQGGEPANCDDGNICTQDFCDELAGCQHVPIQSPCCQGDTSVCDDGNPCTDDFCDPETGGCEYEFNEASCDDGNPCTVDDVCSEGSCSGAPKSCDDGNPCTDDFCDPAQGCVHSDLDGKPCDDGLACSTNDVCVDGVCQGDMSECGCEPDFSPDATRATEVRIGEGGHPGEGLDLDDDPETCAPSTNCSEGINNALGQLASFANEPLQESVDQGDLHLVLEFRDLQASSFTLAAHQAELAPESSGCDFTTSTCSYLADPAAIDSETCEPMVSLPGTRSGNEVSAGGSGTDLPFNLPLGETELSVTISSVRFEGSLTTEGGEVVGVEGILGGAVKKEVLLTAVDQVPEEELPVDPSLVKQVIGSLEADIDTSGDGSNDALSIGLVMEGIEADLIGMAEEE